MAVTKQIYTASGTWTASQLASIFRSAFIDAGYMTEWHDSFTISGREYRVLKIEYDNTKTYGTTYYYMVFPGDNTQPGVSISSGWNTSTKVPTGTQYLDYHQLPTNYSNANSNSYSSSFTSNVWSPSTTSDFYLDRYTSGVDSRQSWFVLRNGANVSRPFTFIPKTLSLYSWLDLSKGVINGYMNIRSGIFNSSGSIVFAVQENIRRSLVMGSALRGDSNSDGSGRFHHIEFSSFGYVGLGSVSNNTVSNYVPANQLNGSTQGGGVIPLPVGRSYVNSAFASDYVPICTEVPWNPYGTTLLASDFAVYMHYANNTINYGDKFIVSAGVEEWQVVTRTNNTIITDSASPVFLARVV